MSEKGELVEMIDIHCHILPGVDDGAKDLQDSLALARGAVAEGIKTIIATPHHKNGHYENKKDEILAKTAELNQALQEENVPLTVLPGQETRIFGEILDDYRNGDILTINNGGKYLFIELPSDHVPYYTEQLLFDIQLAGLVPIIVHPERNKGFLERPEMLFQLVKKGALTQVTGASLAGFFGKKIRKFSLQMVEANLTHFVASDAHNMVNRTFKMNEAFTVLDKEFGADTVYFFQENAALLIEGKNVYRDEPLRIKQKKLFGIF